LGYGIQKNLSLAKKHFQQAANKGHTGAQEAMLDAVDIHNRGLKYLKETEFEKAHADLTNIIYDYDSLDGMTKDIEMSARFNRGVANYNKAINKKNDGLMTAAVIEATRAISDWEEVIRYDTSSERIAQAKVLIENTKRKIGLS